MSKLEIVSKIMAIKFNEVLFYQLTANQIIDSLQYSELLLCFDSEKMKVTFEGGEFICCSELPENEFNNVSISENDMFEMVQIEVEKMYQKDQLEAQ